MRLWLRGTLNALKSGELAGSCGEGPLQTRCHSKQTAERSHATLSRSAEARHQSEMSHGMHSGAARPCYALLAPEGTEDLLFHLLAQVHWLGHFIDLTVLQQPFIVFHLTCRTFDEWLLFQMSQGHIGSF